MLYFVINRSYCYEDRGSLWLQLEEVYKDNYWLGPIGNILCDLDLDVRILQFPAVLNPLVRSHFLKFGDVDHLTSSEFFCTKCGHSEKLRRLESAINM